MIKIAPSIGSKGIGVLTERRLSYVDHLVPLCQLIDIPLLVTDRWIYEIIQLYYPPMQLVYFDPDDNCLDDALYGYDYFVYTEPSRKVSGHFEFCNHYTTVKARSIFTHHGNSEKSFGMYWFERLMDEDILLIYGEHMLEMMRAIGVTKPFIKCGNYRLAYYQLYKIFFQRNITLHLFEPSKRKTLLYAPTWAGSNLYTEWRFEYSTCLEKHQSILEEIPNGYQVLVKLHPNHLLRMPDETEKLIASYQGNPQIRFIHDFPLIYPLLEHTDLYVGDFSSIGYDFLYFDRPMFFLTGERERMLNRCGISLGEKGFWKRVHEDQSHLSLIRKQTYEHAFGSGICTLIS